MEIFSHAMKKSISLFQQLVSVAFKMDNDDDRRKSPKDFINKRDESTKKSIYMGFKKSFVGISQIREANTAAATTKALSPNTSPRSPINGGDQNQEITDREFESLALLHIAYPPVRCSATDLQTLRQVNCIFTHERCDHFDFVEMARFSLIFVRFVCYSMVIL